MGILRSVAGAAVRGAWERAGRWAVIGDRSEREAVRSFGPSSAICFPVAAYGSAT